MASHHHHHHHLLSSSLQARRCAPALTSRRGRPRRFHHPRTPLAAAAAVRGSRRREAIGERPGEGGDRPSAPPRPRRAASPPVRSRGFLGLQCAPLLSGRDGTGAIAADETWFVSALSLFLTCRCFLFLFLVPRCAMRCAARVGVRFCLLLLRFCFLAGFGG